jgi:hypothetical protein
VTFANISRHVEIDLLPYRYLRQIGLADEGREPDRGEIADYKHRIAGAGIHLLAEADLSLHNGAGDRRESRRFRIDAAFFLKAEMASSVRPRIRKLLRAASSAVCDERRSFCAWTSVA